MAKTKQQKAAILDRLKAALTKVNASVFVHFKGLTVADESAMRRSLKEQGVSYFVAKKTLIRKAVTENGIAGSLPELGGEVAVAYAHEGNTDTTLPSRLIYEFGKKFGGEKLVLLGGVFEEKLQDQRAIVEIATIPSIPVLRGMFANVINSPIQRFAIALGQVAGKK